MNREQHISKVLLAGNDETVGSQRIKKPLNLTLSELLITTSQELSLLSNYTRSKEFIESSIKIKYKINNRIETLTEVIKSFSIINKFVVYLYKDIEIDVEDTLLQDSFNLSKRLRVLNTLKKETDHSTLNIYMGIDNMFTIYMTYLKIRFYSDTIKDVFKDTIDYI